MGGQATEIVTKRAIERLQKASSEIPSTWNVNKRRSEGDINIGIPNYGMSFYITRFRWLPTSGPLGRQGLRAVSLLGVSIWDTKRLLDLGLALPPGVPSMPFGSTWVEKWDGPAGRQLAAWRSVFLQELRRVRGTWLGYQVLTDDCSAWLDVWAMDALPKSSAGLISRMTEFGLSTGEMLYDGPLQWEGSRGLHDSFVRFTVKVIRAKLLSYQWPTGTAGAQGAQGGGVGLANL